MTSPAALALSNKPKVNARTMPDASEKRIQQIARFLYVCLIVAATIATIASFIFRPSRPTPERWTFTSVQQSSSLWEVARAYPVDGLNTSETVDLIKTANGLDTGVVTPGQLIRVPSRAPTPRVADSL